MLFCSLYLYVLWTWVFISSINANLWEFTFTNAQVVLKTTSSVHVLTVREGKGDSPCWKKKKRTFLLLAEFVVLNMLVGVVVENFQKCRDIIEKDRQAEKEKKSTKKLQSGVVF